MEQSAPSQTDLAHLQTLLASAGPGWPQKENMGE